MSRIAWAAGLFDGEGSTFVTTESKVGVQTPRGRARVRLHIAVQMSDEEPIRRFGEAVGVGRVCGPYAPTSPKKNGAPRKPLWRWTADKETEIRQALEMLWPWLSDFKKSQASEAIAKRDACINTPIRTDFRLWQICLKGHDLSVWRYVAPNGHSYCRLCQLNRGRAWRQRKRDDAGMFLQLAAE